jgi:hypothetical protein
VLSTKVGRILDPAPAGPASGRDPDQAFREAYPALVVTGPVIYYR